MRFFGSFREKSTLERMSAFYDLVTDKMPIQFLGFTSDFQGIWRCDAEHIWIENFSENKRQNLCPKCDFDNKNNLCRK